MNLAAVTREDEEEEEKKKVVRRQLSICRALAGSGVSSTGGLFPQCRARR